MGVADGLRQAADRKEPARVNGEIEAFFEGGRKDVSAAVQQRPVPRVRETKETNENCPDSGREEGS